MSHLENIADRFEIEALHGEFSDAAMMRDYDHVASLFTPDGVLRFPDTKVEIIGREEIRAGAERFQSLWEYFVQMTHPGAIRVHEDDTATGRAYMTEFGRMRDGSSHQNHGIYHDRYQRTPEGWKFTERTYEVRYLDTTPLPGTAQNVPGAG